MFRTVDSLNGRKCAVVYEAPTHPVSAELGRWEKSKAVAAFLKANGAKAALVVKDGASENWLAAEGPGYSFQAAVEAWVESDEEKDEERSNATVVVPLDERIYVAELSDGLVEGEAVTVPGKALDAVRSALEGGGVVVVFEGGRQTAAAAALVKPDPMEMDLYGYRFRSVMPVVLAAGLFHRVYLAVPAMATAFAGGALLDFGAVDEAGNQRLPALDQYERVHPFSAKAQLDELGALLGPGFAGALYAAGWDRLDIEAPSFSASGSSLAYPETAEAMAAARGASFTLSPDGWRLGFQLAPLPESERVDGHGHDAVVRAVFEAGRIVGGQVSLVGVIDRNSTSESQLEIRVERASEAHLRALGSALEGLPVMMGGAVCEMDKWIAGACTVGLLAKGEKGA